MHCFSKIFHLLDFRLSSYSTKGEKKIYHSYQSSTCPVRSSVLLSHLFFFFIHLFWKCIETCSKITENTFLQKQLPSCVCQSALFAEHLDTLANQSSVFIEFLFDFFNFSYNNFIRAVWMRMSIESHGAQKNYLDLCFACKQMWWLFLSKENQTNFLFLLYMTIFALWLSNCFLFMVIRYAKFKYPSVYKPTVSLENIIKKWSVHIIPLLFIVKRWNRNLQNLILFSYFSFYSHYTKKAKKRKLWHHLLKNHLQ